MKKGSRPALQIVALDASDPDDVPVTTRQPMDARPDAATPGSRSARELTLDFDALEGAAQDAVTASLFHSADLPPPPKNLLAARKDTGGGYRTGSEPRLGVAEPHVARTDPREEPDGPSVNAGRPQPATSARAAPAAAAPARAAAAAPSRPPGEARYAPARPAAIFGGTQRPPPASLFSDDLVTDKSLDEVILSYLAEDLEPPRRK
jgi:hypothetical protein